MTRSDSIRIRRKQVHEMIFDAFGLLQGVETDKGCFVVVPNGIRFNHTQRRDREGRKPIPDGTKVEGRAIQENCGCTTVLPH
jgi:hypothetical protein